MSLSKAVIMGTVTRNPEKRFTNNNLPITTIAVNISENDDELLLKVVAMGKLAEKAEQFSKGSKIIIEGRLQTNAVKSTSGEEKKIFEVSAQAIEAVGGVASTQASNDNVDDSSVNALFEDQDVADELIGEDEIPF